MHGNVSQWCDGAYLEGSSYVLRDGIYNSPGSFCRAATRKTAASNVHGHRGIRLVRVPAGKASKQEMTVPPVQGSVHPSAGTIFLFRLPGPAK